MYIKAGFAPAQPSKSCPRSNANPEGIRIPTLAHLHMIIYMVISPMFPRTNPAFARSPLERELQPASRGHVRVRLKESKQRPAGEIRHLHAPNKSQGRRSTSSLAIGLSNLRITLMRKTRPQLACNDIDASSLGLKSPVLRLMQKIGGAGVRDDGMGVEVVRAPVALAKARCYPRHTPQGSRRFTWQS